MCVYNILMKIQSFCLSLKPILKEEIIFSALGITLSCRTAWEKSFRTEHLLCVRQGETSLCKSKLEQNFSSHTLFDYSKATIGDQLYASSGFSAEGNIKHFWYNQTMVTDYLHTAHCVKISKQSTNPGFNFPL